MGNETKKPLSACPEEAYEYAERKMTNYQLTLALKLIAEGSDFIATVLLLDCNYDIVACVSEHVTFLTAVLDALEADYELPRYIAYRVLHNAGIENVISAQEFADARLAAKLLGMAGYVDRAKEELREIDARYVA